MNDPERIAKERQLRAAVLRGDEMAWRSWYDESAAGLRAYVAWRLGGRREGVDEIVQETWLVAVRNVRSFAPEQGSFAGWLRGVAANLIRNYLRKNARAVRSLEPLSDEQARLAGDEERGQAERAERTAAALDALPAHYEAVLRAKYFEGLPVATIAEERGETAKAVESLLTRARAAFRERYCQGTDVSTSRETRP
ncbi:MAG TPA: sigma-70 family RNA polymerase sigma factor [Pirellulales bacterium]|nr:sigma-70 family RNA polymerase sigma factor [Pirellulales bacterium]